MKSNLKKDTTLFRDRTLEAVPNADGDVNREVAPARLELVRGDGRARRRERRDRPAALLRVQPVGVR